jgi:DNA-binding MarR family transcriptional regulator
MGEATSIRQDAIARQAAAMREYIASSVLLQDAIARSSGLSGSDLQVVGVLMSEGAMTPGMLAQRTGLGTGGAITSAVDRLEREGYVRRDRDPVDRRRVLVKAVEDRILERVGAVYGRITDRWTSYLDTLSDEQLAFASELFERADEVNRVELDQLGSAPRPTG